MLFLKRWMAVVVAVVMIAATQAALAQGKGKGGGGKGQQGGVKYGAGQPDPQQMQKAVQQINQKLQQGEKELKVAREKANEVRLEWQKVDTEHKKHAREVTQSKKSAEVEAKSDPALKAARAKTDELRQQLAEIRMTVAARLTKDDEEYQAALSTLAEAVSKQKANAGAEADVRKMLARSVAETEKSLRAIEEIKMAENSDAKRVHAELKEALAEMAVILRKNHEAIETDPRLSSAKVAFQRTRDELKAATAARDQADGAANRIQSFMQAMIRERTGIEAQQQFLQKSQAGQQGQNGNKKSGKR